MKEFLEYKFYGEWSMGRLLGWTVGILVVYFLVKYFGGKALDSIKDLFKKDEAKKIADEQDPEKKKAFAKEFADKIVKAVSKTVGFFDGRANDWDGWSSQVMQLDQTSLDLVNGLVVEQMGRSLYDIADGGSSGSWRRFSWGQRDKLMDFLSSHGISA